MAQHTEQAVFGGGCFWCTEAVFEQLRGVVSVMPGYAGGHAQNPRYEQVCSGSTGHAEAIRIEFDPAQVSYRDLLTVFFATHDPTTPNQQGHDIGSQYRSIILYANEGQEREAETFLNEISPQFRKPIVTELKPLEMFYEAERYHRQYYRANSGQPYCQVVIDPKIEHFRERFRQLLK